MVKVHDMAQSVFSQVISGLYLSIPRTITLAKPEQYFECSPPTFRNNPVWIRGYFYGDSK